MIFPELKIIEEVENKNLQSDYKIFLICQLDWETLDKHRIERKKKWILDYKSSNLKDNEIEFLNELLEKSDWNMFNYPDDFTDLYNKYSSILIPKTYYNEIIHYRDLAIQEWSRNRPFDTNVRETCLSVGESCVDNFFYLLYDCIYIYNKDLFDNFNLIMNKLDTKEFDILERDNFHVEINILRVLWLFRFWKNQTGGGLVINKSFKHLNDYTKYDILKGQLRPFLIKSLDYDPIFGYDYRDNNINYEKELATKLKSMIRNSILSDILTKKESF
jgi:hypothetical protein